MLRKQVRSQEVHHYEIEKKNLNFQALDSKISIFKQSIWRKESDGAKFQNIFSPK
jgi:hypothetical protein